jgi:hypothetical protein
MAIKKNVKAGKTKVTSLSSMFSLIWSSIIMAYILRHVAWKLLLLSQGILTLQIIAG